MEGLYKRAQGRRRERREHRRGNGLTIEERVAASWILDGYSALAAATDAQKDDIVQRWHERQAADHAEKAAQLALKSPRMDSLRSHRVSSTFSRSSMSIRSKESSKSQDTVEEKLESLASPVKTSNSTVREVEPDIIVENHEKRIA